MNKLELEIRLKDVEKRLKLVESFLGGEKSIREVLKHSLEKLSAVKQYQQQE